MPRVMSEASVFPQVAQQRARFAGEPRGTAPDTFAPLLDERQPLAPDGPQPAKAVETGKPEIPAEHPPSETKLQTEIDLFGGAMPTEAGVAESVPSGSATALADATVIIAPAPSPVAMPSMPVAATGVPVSVASADPVPDVPAELTAAHSPVSGRQPAKPGSAPAPGIGPTAETAGTPEPLPRPETVPASGSASAPGSVSAPKTGASAAPAQAPARAPIGGETEGLPTQPGVEPVPVTGGKPSLQPEPLFAQVERVTHTPLTALPLTIGKPAPAPNATGPGEALQSGEDKAKPGKPLVKGETADPAPTAKRADPRHEPPTPGTNPASADLRAPDIRTMPILDLGTAAIQSVPASQSLASAAAQPAPAAPSVPVPVTGLGIAIAVNAQNGRNQFEIRLDPPELGRIDVRLHFDTSGNVTSHLIVDRSDTLDLLRRDAADLERSLQQAGLKTSDNGLQFSLRDQSQRFDSENGERGPAAQLVMADTEPTIGPMMRGYLHAGQGAGLDIRV